MVALGFLIQDLFGTTTQIFGAAATPGAGLTVAIAPGRIYAQEDLEATAWSSLPADTTDMIMKQGLLFQATTLAGFAAPAATGNSIAYLIEGQYQDFDTSNAVLSYYNAANPQQPFVGPGNNGVSQPLVREGILALQVKAGTSATTGTQMPPAVDAGWTAMYVVTVAHGQTTISTGNIAVASGAPFTAPSLSLVSTLATAYSIASSTVLAPTGLSLTLQPGTYSLEVFLAFSGSSAGGIKLSLVGGTGTFTTSTGFHEVGQVNSTGVNSYSSFTGNTFATLSATDVLNYRGQINVTVAGTIVVQAAQNSSSGTASIVNAGSFMIARAL